MILQRGQPDSKSANEETQLDRETAGPLRDKAGAATENGTEHIRNQTKYKIYLKNSKDQNQSCTDLPGRGQRHHVELAGEHGQRQVGCRQGPRAG